MNKKELFDLIDSLSCDIDFKYKSKAGCICPFARNDISLCYDGNEITVKSVQEAMDAHFVDGYSLSEICDDLNI